MDTADILQESGTRVLELQDNLNPCDFARILQFIYTNEYDREPGDSNASKSMPLDTLVSKEELSREGWGTAGAREKFEIDKALLTLTRYFLVDSLREVVATNMVLSLPPSGDYFDARDFPKFQLEFVKTFRVISGDLGGMPKVRERMVDEIFNFWIREYNETNKTIPSLLEIGNPTTPVDEGLRNFQRQLKGFMEDDALFATEMALAFQRISLQGFGYFKWSNSRIEGECRRQRHRQIGFGQLN